MMHVEFGWMDKFDNNGNSLTETNNGITFMTTGKEEKNDNKEKEMSC